jgi:hypothetical protein
MREEPSGEPERVAIQAVDDCEKGEPQTIVQLAKRRRPDVNGDLAADGWTSIGLESKKSNDICQADCILTIGPPWGGQVVRAPQLRVPRNPKNSRLFECSGLAAQRSSRPNDKHQLQGV